MASFQGDPPSTPDGQPAPPGGAWVVSGVDEDGNVQFLATDTTGRARVVGAAATGVAVAGDPVRIAGSDGALTRDALTDTGGRFIVVGAAADGALPVSNPVLTAGFDGTSVQTLLTDAVGRQRVVGTAASGVAVLGDPVRVAGSDGVTTFDLRTDASGRLRVVGAAADGVALVTAAVPGAGVDVGGLVRTHQLRNTHPDGTEYAQLTRDIERTQPSFYVVYDRIVPAANKYMATLFNTSGTRKVVIQRIWRFNWRNTGAGGITMDQYLTRITARTVGTAVTPVAEDPSDTLSAGITADHNSAGVTEGALIKRLFAHAETVDLSNTAPLNLLAMSTDMQLVYERKPGMRGHVLRANQGVSIRNVTATTAGSVSYAIEFTDEAA